MRAEYGWGPDYTSGDVLNKDTASCSVELFPGRRASDDDSQIQTSSRKRAGRDWRRDKIVTGGCLSSKPLIWVPGYDLITGSVATAKVFRGVVSWVNLSITLCPSVGSTILAKAG